MLLKIRGMTPRCPKYLPGDENTRDFRLLCDIYTGIFYFLVHLPSSIGLQNKLAGAKYTRKSRLLDVSIAEAS
jgi:hypothetical protein